MPTAAILWLRHFEWPGLLLMAVGIFVLVRLRNWPVLALTVSYFVLQQVFNLFYAIGDIFVYYIPLYLVACIWIGFAGAGIGVGFRFTQARGTHEGVPQTARGHAGYAGGAEGAPRLRRCGGCAGLRGGGDGSSKLCSAWRRFC